MQGRLLKAEEVAQTLNICRSFAYQLMRTGQIPCIHIGSSRRVQPRDLEQFISENTHGDGFKDYRANGPEVIGVKSDANGS